jgi:hypothetical protein
MEVTLAISEGLDIFCVVEPLLSLRLHCPDLGIGPGFAAGAGTARLRIVQGFFIPTASALDLPSDPTVKPCLGQSELPSQNASIKLGIHGVVQSSHVGALVKWPRNDEF